MKMFKKSRPVLLGLLVQFFVSSCLCSCLDGPYFDKLAFYKLDVGNPLQSNFVQDFLKCFLHCANFLECLSLNVADQPNQDGLYECVLLKNSTKQFPELLRPSTVYHHYARRFSDKCTTQRCKNGGTCETLANDFRCHCPQNFTGRQCENLLCNTSIALGMESGAIPDSSFTSSSEMSNYTANAARLNGPKEWTPSPSTDKEWIQVDLSTVTKVTHIATQGSCNLDEYVKTYSLQSGLNSHDLVDYQRGRNFTGNIDHQTVVKQAIQPAITARYIRLQPKSWNGRISLRLEFYGCR